MIGGLKRTTSRFAVAAAAGLFIGGMAASPASAADLGGDCCADLEERVAELEATTVRKGNRKVSVKLSGQVNRSLLWWDDGEETDLYSVDNAASNTRIRLTGSAQIRHGWSAGFYIEWSLVSNSSSATDQTFDPHNAGGGLSLRHAVWWMKWDRFGQIWVGQHSAATDNLIYLGAQSVGQGGHDYNLVGGGFFLTRAGVSGNPGHLIPERYGTYLPGFDVANRHDLIRYDSPDILGCVFSASWGEDDIWDVAARCKKELNSVKVLLGVGYIERTVSEDWIEVPFTTGDTFLTNERVGGPNDFIIAGSIAHDPSGLYIHGVWAHREFDSPHTASITPGVVTGRLTPGDVESWYVQAGIYRRWNDLGKTALYLDWRHADDANVGASGANFRAGSEIVSTEGDAYGGGIVQNIDNAAMEVYVDYKHVEVDVTTCTGIAGECTAFFNEALDDFDRINMGARIKF